MKKTIFVFIFTVTVFFCAFVGNVHGQNTTPIDLILILDTSTAMSSSYENVNNYLSRDFLSEFLRVGDTFHLITFAGNPRLDSARRILGSGNVETIIGRMLIQYPVETGNNVSSALSFTEQYITTLPNRAKKIVLVTIASQNTAGLVTSVKQRLTSGSTIDYVQVTPGQRLSNLPSSGRASSSSTTASQPAAPRQTPAATTPPATRPAATPSAAATPPASSPASTAATPAASSTTSQTAPSATRPASSAAAPQAAPSATQPSSSAATPPAASTTSSASTPASAPTTSAASTSTPAAAASSTSPAAASASTSPAAASTSPSTTTPAASTLPGASEAAGITAGARDEEASSSSLTEDAASSDEAVDITAANEADEVTDTTRSDVSAPAVSDKQEKAVSSQKSAVPAVKEKKSLSGSGKSFTSSLPFIIGIIILILLILGLIIFLLSRRLNSSPNRVMTSSSAPPKEEAAADTQNNLADFAAGQPRQRTTPYDDRITKDDTKPFVINPSGPLLLNLFVNDQNTSIGKRNIHSLKSGYSLTVGGGKSDDYFIFLVPVPAKLGEIRRDGSQLTFIPHKAKYFPDIGSNQVKDCINKTIRIISDKNYEMRFRFEMYEDPLIALNRLLHSVKVPG